MESFKIQELIVYPKTNKEPLKLEQGIGMVSDFAGVRKRNWKEDRLPRRFMNFKYQAETC